MFCGNLVMTREVAGVDSTVSHFLIGDMKLYMEFAIYGVGTACEEH